MFTVIAQEWVTIRGAGPTTVTQSHQAWLELPQYPNAVAWLQISELNFGVSILKMNYQTSPTTDESLFVSLAGPVTAVPITLSVTGLTVTPIIKDLMSVPLARWFRWQLIAGGTSSWDVTFRLFIAAHSLKPKRR